MKSIKIVVIIGIMALIPILQAQDKDLTLQATIDRVAESISSYHDSVLSLSSAAVEYAKLGSHDRLIALHKEVEAFTSTGDDSILLINTIIVSAMNEQALPKREDLHDTKQLLSLRHAIASQLAVSHFMIRTDLSKEGQDLFLLFRPLTMSDVPEAYRRDTWAETRRDIAVIWFQVLSRTKHQLGKISLSPVAIGSGLTSAERERAREIESQNRLKRVQMDLLGRLYFSGIDYLKRLYITHPVNRDELALLASIYDIDLNGKIE
jgi:hypothetical protein